MGTSDLSKELNVTSRRALQLSLQMVVLAAKKYGKVVLDGVYLNVRDLEGFEKECWEVFRARGRERVGEGVRVRRENADSSVDDRVGQSGFRAFSDGGGGCEEHHRLL